jgi:hypothetical protein
LITYDIKRKWLIFSINGRADTMKSLVMRQRTIVRFLNFIITKEFIRKATDPHPCPLPSRERGLKNRPSLKGRG